MYSCIFEAIDNAGNTVKARTFFLYDNSSFVVADEEHSVEISGVVEIDSNYWITSSGATVTVAWKNRYEKL